MALEEDLLYELVGLFLAEQDAVTGDELAYILKHWNVST